MSALQSAVVWARAHAIEIVLRLVAASVVLVIAWFGGRLLGAWLERVLRKRRPRSKTLGSVVAATARTTALVLGTVMALDQLGLNVRTLLAGAGIAGLAIGFGAQTLVKDVLSGFFLILDGAIADGDFVEIGTAKGVIEQVGLRVTKLRSEDGRLWYLPNGTIREVANFNRGYRRASVDLNRVSADEAQRIAEALEHALRELDPRDRQLLSEQPRVDLRLFPKPRVTLSAKTPPDRHDAAKQALERVVASVVVDYEPAASGRIPQSAPAPESGERSPPAAPLPAIR